MPRRIQCRPGSRIPAGVVVIIRGSRWENPFQVGTTTPPGSPVGGDIEVRDRAHSVALFRSLVDAAPGLRAAIRTHLAGKDLACSCAFYGQDGAEIPCHGDRLLEVANPDPHQRCYECGAIYASAAELLRGFNADRPPGTAALIDPTGVRHCPQCLHDFLFPPRAAATSHQSTPRDSTGQSTSLTSTLGALPSMFEITAGAAE